MSNPNDTQVGGDHYKTGGEEHWDRVHRLGLDYFQAAVTKYVERCWKKNGLEDLKKARHFLDKYISIKEDEQRQYLLGLGEATDGHGPIVRNMIREWEEFTRSANPEFAPLASFPKGRVKPTGWLGFVFEGADAQGFLYTCRSCNANVYAGEDVDPQAMHLCPVERR